MAKEIKKIIIMVRELEYLKQQVYDEIILDRRLLRDRRGEEMCARGRLCVVKDRNWGI